MKVIREKLKTCCAFCRLVYEMIKNIRKLNDNTENNFIICKNICKTVVLKAKLNCYVYGKNNIPNENCLIISNHVSFFDIVIFLSQVDKPVGFAYASNLLKIPILKKYITSLGGVSINHNIENIKQSICSIQNYLSEGSLIIFPEGKCSYSNDEVKHFQRGCFVNLKSMNILIVPAYIKYDKINKLGKWVIPSNKIEIVIGQPFKPYSQMTSRKLSEYTHDIVVKLKNHVNDN